MVGAIPSERRLPSLSFLCLIGCHVFESIEVDCTSGSPCASVGDADTDTDTDSDSDTDTAPVGDPTVGWVTSMSSTEKGIVRVFDPATGEVTTEWITDPVSGSPYYEPATGLGLLVVLGGVYQLAEDGSTAVVSDGPTNENYDLTHLGHHMLATFLGGIAELSADLSYSEQPIPQGTFAEIKYAGGNARIAYFVDATEGGPDLWQLDTAGSYVLVAADYDTSAKRATNVFVGPEDAPFACSSVGAIYAISDLQLGETDPKLFAVSDLTDVQDCAWDAGSASFLMYSPTVGVYRVDLRGRAELIFTPSAGYTFGRVAWYGN